MHRPISFSPPIDRVAIKISGHMVCAMMKASNGVVSEDQVRDRPLGNHRGKDVYPWFWFDTIFAHLEICKPSLVDIREVSQSLLKKGVSLGRPLAYLELRTTISCGDPYRNVLISRSLKLGIARNSRFHKTGAQQTGVFKEHRPKASAPSRRGSPGRPVDKSGDEFGCSCRSE